MSSAEGLEQSLGHIVPCMREAHVAELCTHMAECPRCMGRLSLTLDGKTARRRICAHMNGFDEYPELGVKVQCGCRRHAPSTSAYCHACAKEQPEGAPDPPACRAGGGSASSADDTDEEYDRLVEEVGVRTKRRKKTLNPDLSPLGTTSRGRTSRTDPLKSKIRMAKTWRLITGSLTTIE